MSEVIQPSPVEAGALADTVDALVVLGLTRDIASILADRLLEQGRKAAADIQELVDQIQAQAERAIEERNAYRELCETWSALSCQNAIEIGNRNYQISELRDCLKQALDWLAGFHHEAALEIRMRAEKLG